MCNVPNLVVQGELITLPALSRTWYVLVMSSVRKRARRGGDAAPMDKDEARGEGSSAARDEVTEKETAPAGLLASTFRGARVLFLVRFRRRVVVCLLVLLDSVGVVAGAAIFGGAVSVGGTWAMFWLAGGGGTDPGGMCDACLLLAVLRWVVS